MGHLNLFAVQVFFDFLGCKTITQQLVDLIWTNAIGPGYRLQIPYIVTLLSNTLTGSWVSPWSTHASITTSTVIPPGIPSPSLASRERRLIHTQWALMANVTGTPWEPIIVLGGLYGLRLSEILGLRWRNVDLDKNSLSVIEQLPYKLPAGTVDVGEIAPIKSGNRTLPITDITRPCFLRQRALQEEQERLMVASGQTYHHNDLVIARPDGAPKRRERVSPDFSRLLRHLGMPHIRFHDTRHSAATNMHELTGDFFTVIQILGHSLKGAGIQLNLSSNLDSVTAQYVDVRLERKLVVLDTYHQAVLGQG